ncbi:MAG TPA: two-component regulator propeller domain-containing protein [Flavisolibacter sp.]|nr:two-component regulator propeller domain-containing protein [Flavisolibacter sp.]
MRFLFIICFLLTAATAPAQTPHFHSLNAAKGLNDGSIRAFGQDKYGYIWIGTQSGLNRYDSYSVSSFLHRPGDSTSIYPGGVSSIVCAGNGNLYIGFSDGIVQYDYHSSSFRRIKADRPFAAGHMLSQGRNTVLVATSEGLAELDASTGRISFLSDRQKDTAQKELMKQALVDICLTQDRQVIATSRRGLVVYDLAAGTVSLRTVPGLGPAFYFSVEATPSGTVWVSLIDRPVLIRTNTRFSDFTVYNYIFPGRTPVPNAISDLLVDGKGRLWVTTVNDGLCLYHPETNVFSSFTNDPFLPLSPTANHFTALFQDRQGLIWAGTEGYGVNYFDPDKNLFQTILPRKSETTAGGWMWGRAAAEDDEGNFWLATLDGVMRYTPGRGVTGKWKNEEGRPRILYSNSVRGVLYDSGMVWMITGGGVNRYHIASGKMDFLGKKDALPEAFYFSGLKDSRGNIWIGGRDFEGLYCRQPGQAGFSGIGTHPVLKDINRYGVRSIFEDRGKRLWFGLNGGGLACYNEAAGTLRHWKAKEGDSTSLSGDLVTGIAQDRAGRIWVSTFSGIACYDEATNKFTQFGRHNGLPSTRTSCIQVDRQDRVWAGSTKGLLMLDRERRLWKVFDEGDGLPTMEFTDMPSYISRDGRFIFPSLKGFVAFDPEQYAEAHSPLSAYISGIEVFNQPANVPVNYEELKNISFRHSQNFFTIRLSALNYENPSQTWYAYKLEGFDKDWIYTKERAIHYTNVPGGSYRFLYKASPDAANWTDDARQLSVHVDTIYYKTASFWLAMLLLAGYGLYLVYRFRMNKQRQILRLETKAKELEKEKTVVQYESLKQHLNPHFLFNSLTSLRSLIKTDTRTATIFLDGLSKIYRYVLKSRERELTTVREEIDFVQTFVTLQKIRFGEGLQVTVQLDDGCLKRMVVPVTLQNLVENAIKHNTADSESPLCINISAADEYIVVQNNLQRYHIVETSNRQGLTNLHNLYRFYTKKPVLIEEDQNSFTVKIPLL